MADTTGRSARSLLVVLLGALSVGNAVASTSSGLKEADAVYAAGRFADAEHQYRELLKADPENPRVYEMLGTIALWRNDLTSAERYLRTALGRRSWVGRQWPLNVQINTHLGLAYARAGRLREAAAALTKAAGPVALGPLKELKVRARQLELFDGEAPYLVQGPPVAIVPFVITDPLPVVRISVNGSPPANFFIDTGGEGLVLDAGFARDVGATVVGELLGEYAGGEKGLTGYGRVDRVALGEVLVRNVPVSCLDLQSVAKTVFPGTDIRGIIGTGLLMQFLATIDYPGQRLILRRSAATPREVDEILSLNEADRVFPIWLVETHLIFAEGSVNHLDPGLMLIDTGLADAGFLASKEVFAEAGVDMDWSKAGMGAGGGGMTKGLAVSVDEVALGNGDAAIRRRDVRGVVLEGDMSMFKGTLGFRVAGLVSHQFFRDYAVTFDFANMRLILQR